MKGSNISKSETHLVYILHYCTALVSQHSKLKCETQPWVLTKCWEWISSPLTSYHDLRKLNLYDELLLLMLTLKPVYRTLHLLDGFILKLLIHSCSIDLFARWSRVLSGTAWNRVFHCLETQWPVVNDTMTLSSCNTRDKLHLFIFAW